MSDTGPWALDLPRGQSLFLEKCQQCHGPNGVGGYGPALTSTITCPPCAEFTQLWRRIDEYMPFRNPEACDAACSRDIAAWISNGFATTPSCSVEFRYDTVTAGHFTATLRITNFRNLDVPKWRLGFTLPIGHTLTASTNAVATHADGQALLRPFEDAPRIADGAMLAIGLEGMHAGTPIVPTDLRLEASPCFTATPVGN